MKVSESLVTSRGFRFSRPPLVSLFEIFTNVVSRDAIWAFIFLFLTFLLVLVIHCIIFVSA